MLRKTASTIGSNDGAFSVSRTELLQWVNGLLDLNLTKVEQCASGAVYCQILDACHPNTVAMHKVNWMAKIDYEFLANFKVLQAAFDRHRICRDFNVDRIIRGRNQDILELLQWMKCYWERSGVVEYDDPTEQREEGASGGYEYDPAARRQGKQLPCWASVPPSEGERPAETENAAVTRRASQKENLSPRAANSMDVGKPRSATKAAAPRSVAAAPRSPRSASKTAAAEPKSLGAEKSPGLSGVQKAQLHGLTAQEVQLLEHERYYYFNRLREVELLCKRLQEQQGEMPSSKTVVADVLDIIYAEGEAQAGWEQPAEL